MSSFTASHTSSTLQKVTITLARNDLKPPIYIAGSFTSIPWEPEEMELSRQKVGEVENKFSKTFNISPGTYQYKFRLGYGDWWICDEDSNIATDEAGNSNNQLIVPKPHLPEAPNHTDLPSVKLPKVNESIDPEINDLSPQIPIMSGGENTETSRQESFLGTWEPSQELSPMHRRASTSLGIRISRIGTFLPPDSTAEDSKYSKQDDILSSMDVLKQNLSGNGFSELAEDENQFLSHEQERIDINASVSVNRSEEYQASIASNLDGILEVNSAVSNSPPVLNNPDTIYSRLPEHNQSYGTISTSSSMKATNGQLGERHISRTDSVNPNPGQPTFPELKMVNGDSRIDRKASDSSMESIAEQKAEEVASKEESRGLRFLVMLFTWIRYLWKWLFGRPKRAEQ